MVEWSGERLLRAWTSFAALQCAGTLFFSIVNGAKFSSRIYNETNELAVRNFAVVLTCLLIIRIFLILHHNNRPLHMCHALLCTVSASQMLAEIFHYRTTKPIYANLFIAGISVASALFTGLFLLCNNREQDPVKERGPRRIGPRIHTKHFMENDVLGPLPDNPTLSGIKKTQ